MAHTDSRAGEVGQGQYEHIKESAEERGASEGRAKEIASRTVNKERARSGEAKSASRTSTGDSKSASQRGGERSRRGAQGPTKDQLYEEAKKKHVEGRSTMNGAGLLCRPHDRAA
nr:plasmid stabilization protein [Streptomyces sp. NBC_00830]